MDCKVLHDEELMALFQEVAERNGTTAEAVLSSFIRDYIVSGGHPEQVGDRQAPSGKS